MAVSLLRDHKKLLCSKPHHHEVGTHFDHQFKSMQINGYQWQAWHVLLFRGHVKQGSGALVVGNRLLGLGPVPPTPKSPRGHHDIRLAPA